MIHLCSLVCSWTMWNATTWQPSFLVIWSWDWMFIWSCLSFLKRRNKRFPLPSHSCGGTCNLLSLVVVSVHEHAQIPPPTWWIWCLKQQGVDGYKCGKQFPLLASRCFLRSHSIVWFCCFIYNYLIFMLFGFPIKHTVHLLRNCVLCSRICCSRTVCEWCIQWASTSSVSRFFRF